MVFLCIAAESRFHDFVFHDFLFIIPLSAVNFRKFIFLLLSIFNQM